MCQFERRPYFFIPLLYPASQIISNKKRTLFDLSALFSVLEPLKERLETYGLEEILSVKHKLRCSTFFVTPIAVSYTHLTLPTKLEV